MLPLWLRRMRGVLFEAGAADDVALVQGDEDQQAVVVRAVVQALAALLHRLVGHLQDLAGHGGSLYRAVRPSTWRSL